FPSDTEGPFYSPGPDYVRTGDVEIPISSMKKAGGVYSFYTNVLDEVNAIKKGKFEVVSDAGINVKITSKTEGYTQGNNGSTGAWINVRDAGVGLAYVKVTDPQGKSWTFEPSSRNTSNYIVSNPNNGIAINTNENRKAQFYDSGENKSKNFEFFATMEGEYKIEYMDHCGSTGSFNHNVTMYDLTVVAKDPSTGNIIKSVSVANVIEKAGLEYNVKDLVVENSSSSLPSSATMLKDGKETLDEIFICPGYGIQGWTATSNGSIVTANDRNSNFKPTNLGDVTIEVSWKALLTLIYHSNAGGDGKIIYKYIEQSNGSTISITSPGSYNASSVYSAGSEWTSDFYLRGNYLDGWATSSSATSPASGFDYPNNGGSISHTVTNGTAIYLYAVWKPIDFVVSFNDNGANNPNAMAQVPYTFSNSVVIDATNQFIKKDNCFENWTLNIDNARYASSSSLLSTANNNEKLLTLLNKNQSVTTNNISLVLTANWIELEFGIDWSKTGDWGSEANPYIIRNNDHLTNLADIVNGNSGKVRGSMKGSTCAGTTNPVVAAGDYTFAGACFVVIPDEDLTLSTPIGKNGNLFAGTFDGNGNTINLSISGQSYAGLFGYTSGVVKGINVTGSVSGVDFVGGIAGYNSGTVTNCINNATITASGGAVGGVVGENYGIVERCVNMSSSI
ncbi:MAG: hypothetical protein IKW16_01250, partial [Clostridia bacterium]|nr:hypothetical protein [Clostridia bacterium]